MSGSAWGVYSLTSSGKKVRYPARVSVSTRHGTNVAEVPIGAIFCEHRKTGSKIAMAWAYLFGLGLTLWSVCGAAIAIGRRLWTLDTTLRVHLAVAPVISFIVSAIHKALAPDFNFLLRATVLTGLVITLDASVVAPLFERSYAMFRSIMGTWLPFAAIFFASVAAGLLVPA